MAASHLTRKLHCIRQQVLLISALKFTRLAVVASCFLTSTMRIDNLQKQVDQLTASQQKAANPNLQLTASDFHITEYSDAIVARIIERIDIVSANEIKIEFIGGYTVTAPLQS